MLKKGVRSFCGAAVRWTCVLLALAWQSVYGQVLYGSMVGNVTDASGAAVPNATVEVTQMETQLTRKAVTDAGGQYTLSTLSPGSYNVKVTAAGFKTFDKTNVPVTLNNVSRVDASLQVGEVNQTRSEER